MKSYLQSAHSLAQLDLLENHVLFDTIIRLHVLDLKWVVIRLFI
jgi:hypothetical protein